MGERTLATCVLAATMLIGAGLALLAVPTVVIASTVETQKALGEMASLGVKDLKSLSRAAEDRGVPHRVGIGHSKDAFYSEHPDLVADPEGMRRRWAALRKANVLATEMESAVLFVIGQLRRVRVGTVCIIIGEPVDRETKITEKPPLDDLILVALDALVSLAGASE